MVWFVCKKFIIIQKTFLIISYKIIQNISIYMVEAVIGEILLNIRFVFSTTWSSNSKEKITHVLLQGSTVDLFLFVLFKMIYKLSKENP